MAETGHAVQVVTKTNNNTYELNVQELKKLLLDNEIKDIPVVVVSVAGPYRTGKSFLLNFFIRYLSSPQSAREDGSWLGDDNEPLVGFAWRHGISRVTKGISMWSKPFLTTLPNGNKVAILLMDTKGTFDNTSSARDCSTIFALSTLISSVQIYNLSQNIQDDDLQHLQLLVEYGKMVKDQGSKAFQFLEFLVRDWQFPEEYEDLDYGAVGGEQLLDEKLQITPTLPKEMQELRQNIRSTFEKVSCFLMPHPGMKVMRKNFLGNIADIDIDFKTQLVNLVKSLFGSEKLMIKLLNRQQIKARDVYTCFETYMALFSSNTVPSPTSIMMGTIEASSLIVMNEARELYEKGMDVDCGPQLPTSVPAGDLQVLHDMHKAKATAFFTVKIKEVIGFTRTDELLKYLYKLKKDMDQLLSNFTEINIYKEHQTINKANEAYENAVTNISRGQPLCVHQVDVIEVHNKGVEAAIYTFDKARKRITNRPDEKGTEFKESLQKRYTLLRLFNDRNNKIVVSELHMEYWQYMLSKCALDPPLTDKDFKEEHKAALKRAQENLDSKRNMPNSYTEDIYKYMLQSDIKNSFAQLKKINNSKKLLEMVTLAVNEYDKYMKSMFGKCIHPGLLDRENQNGLCRALVAMRPQKLCSFGFDNNDETETVVMEILKKRYDDIKRVNDSVNEEAVQAAYNIYLSMMETHKATVQLTFFFPTTVFTDKDRKLHEEAKSKAKDVFYAKRFIGEHSTLDPYIVQLEQMMDHYYSQYCS